jgi:hypothetical protein
MSSGLCCIIRIFLIGGTHGSKVEELGFVFLLFIGTPQVTRFDPSVRRNRGQTTKRENGHHHKK